MKFWQRLFSLFSCLVLLFAVFSIPAAAADDTIKKVHVVLHGATAGVYFGQIDVQEGETGINEGQVYHDLQGEISVRNGLTLANVDGSILFPSGSQYSLLIENISFDSVVSEDSGTVHTFSFGDGSVRSWYTLSYTYANGTEESKALVFSPDDSIIYNDAKENHTIKLSVKSDQDILKITVNEFIDPSYQRDFVSTHGTVDLFSGFEYPLKVSIEKEDKNTGLLQGLLEWVKSIGEKVSDSFDVINSGFANIGTWFAELPSKIWDVMENGIKGLFVPDDEYMTEYSDKWDSLLSDRLGAVYQVCDITVNSWGDIMAADHTDTIAFPSVTIPLPEGASFTFGGYDVQIVPDGFSALATAVKSAVGILCTYLFVNGLLKRYEEVMGVRE